MFPAVDSRALDVYPGFPPALLPVLEVLRWCEETEVDVIHAATPGPVGMVAWLLANSLDLPLIGTYHTDLPNLGFFLTGDHFLKESLWAYVRVFYDQCAIVLCPSQATCGDLVEHRVKSSLQLFPQGIDCDLFNPRRRDEALHDALGDGRSVLLWVGRISPEKGLDALAAVYAALRAKRDDVRLVIVGDGPDRDRFQAVAPEASFLGVKTGVELAAIFASADVFLFPGQIETFGQTVSRPPLQGCPRSLPPARGPRRPWCAISRLCRWRRATRWVHRRGGALAGRSRVARPHGPRRPGARPSAAPGRPLSSVSPTCTALSPCESCPVMRPAGIFGRRRRPQAGPAVFALAHHDDEVFCAGHLHRALREGRSIRLLWATSGGLASPRRRLAEGEHVQRYYAGPGGLAGPTGCPIKGPCSGWISSPTSSRRCWTRALRTEGMSRSCTCRPSRAGTPIMTR